MLPESADWPAKIFIKGLFVSHRKCKAHLREQNIEHLTTSRSLCELLNEQRNAPLLVSLCPVRLTDIAYVSYQLNEYTHA